MTSLTKFVDRYDAGREWTPSLSDYHHRDDVGLATGASMRAAVQAVTHHDPHQIVIADRCTHCFTSNL